MPPSYPLTCPLCGTRIQPVRGASPETTPWVCRGCARGWWPAELSPDARAALDRRTRSFTQQWVREAALRDRDAARQRGSSDLPDHPPIPPTPRRAARRKR